jgi:hypothetical protein
MSTAAYLNSRILYMVLKDTEPPQLRRALPSVEHFVSCHPGSRLHKCGRILYLGTWSTQVLKCLLIYELLAVHARDFGQQLLLPRPWCAAKDGAGKH